MVCCADDITYRGMVCNHKSAPDLNTRDWVVVKAKLSIRSHKLYGSEGPVLEAVEIDRTTPPVHEVATF